MYASRTMYLIWVAISFCSFCLFFLRIWNSKRNEYWKKRGISYLPATPLFSRNIFESFLIKYSLLSEVYHVSEDSISGLFQFRRPALLARSPSMVNVILNKEFRYFHNRRISECTEGNEDPLSHHLLALSGTKWKFLRAKLTPTFTSEKLKFMFPLLQKCLKNLIDSVEAAGNNALDAKELCGKMSMDSIASCAFGLDLNCLGGKNHDFIWMAKAPFRSGSWNMFKAHFRLMYPRAFRVFNFNNYGQNVNDFYCSLVADTIAMRKKTVQKRADFIQLLMKLYEEEQKPMKNINSVSSLRVTDNLIAAQVFSFFIGGYETTSLTMTCALYELVRHEGVRKKLQDEIDSVVTESSGITYDLIKSLKYLDMVIKEVLRLHPPAFYTQRICAADFKVPGTELVVEKNMEIFIPILEIHHDEKYFPEPLKFIPERFGRHKDKIVSGSYLPFGDGPRKCIGMRFSLMELKLVLVRMLSEYNIQPGPGFPHQLQLEEYSRLYSIVNKIPIIFTKRKNIIK